MASRLSVFVSELKRRRVYHVAAAYMAVGTTVVVAAQFLLVEVLGLDTVAVQVVLVLVVLGFPIALVLAWAYELKPEERRKTEQTASPGGEVAQSAQRKSIVVLPFDNLSPDPGDAYFSDGLTEEIITDLTCCGLLRVISRNSSMVLKDTRKGTKEIAEELGVQYVLEGSVRKAGDSLLVTAQLIDAREDEHVWAERFTGTLQDVFEIQGQLSRSIVASLRLRLTSEEERRLLARPTADSRAYDAYLRANHEGSKLTNEGVTRAIRITQEALARVGENALLAATLAQSYYMAYDNGFSHDDETLKNMEEWARKALELDPDLGHSRWAMALVRFKRGDLPGYARYARAAVRLTGDTFQTSHLAIQLSMAGQIEEARALARTAVDRDPLAFISHAALGWVEVMAGDPRTGLNQIAPMIPRLAEGEPFALWWEGQFASFAGDEQRAQVAFSQVAAMNGEALSVMSEIFRRALADDSEGVRELLARDDMQAMGRADEWFPVFFASACARVGDLPAAVLWLEKAVSWGFSNPAFLSRHNPYFEPLRDDPQFMALVRRAEEQSAAFEEGVG